ncbi:TolC family protein [Roseisolibacter sp. H3M3-2]|uniref:TolC family protein n=1 Tax=Roseisolibacter sp. H3M3-2 TaxID=3031323 RepID=UPI0023DCBAB7|nr:TolC family protein [Roseisolibacter sp. H3M3-2]MDF1505451.1 TolC family protein [Roseisolibacter sp. H3M3-2]
MPASFRTPPRARAVLVPVLPVLLTFAACAATAGAQVPAAPAPATASAAPDAARPISLAEAVDLARRNAPAAVQARGQLRASEASIRSAYAAFIPSLSLNANTTQQSPATARVNQQTGELQAGRWAGSAGFNASVDLFDGFRRTYDLRSARATQAAAVTGETAQAFTLAFQVKQQYYASLAARESEVAIQAQLEQARQQLRVSVARVLAQTVTRSDSLRASIAVRNAELALLQARQDRAVADAALTRLVGSPFTVAATPSGAPADAVALPDSAELVRLADQAPSVRQAQANLAAAQAAERSSRTPYFPTLSLSYGRNLTTSSAGFDLIPNDPRFSGQMRFTFSYPVFNQYAREEAVVRADIATTNAEAALRDARLAAQQGLVQSQVALRLAQEQIAVQEATVVASEEDLRVQQQRYELGASTLLDVLTSQTTLNQARVALVQARFNARAARAQLESIIGRDL